MDEIGEAGPPSAGLDAAAQPRPRGLTRWDRARVAASWATTILAGLLLLAVLLVPDRLDILTPAAFLRVPVEALIAATLVAAVPGRARTAVAAVVGVVLGLWGVVHVIDLGFFFFLGRRFDPLLDWGFLNAAMVVVGRSLGRAGTLGAEILTAVVAAVLVSLVTLSVLRLSTLAARHREGTLRTVAVLGVVWVVCLATGAQLVTGEPVAARDALDRIGQVRTSMRDGADFTKQLADDPFRQTPGNELLTALRGKKVVVVLVESYGRVALTSPEIAPAVTGVLDAGQRGLTAQGFSSRSAFLTSPTFGGGSWLAEATLLSGTWVTNQQRYDDLASTSRLTLTGAFQRAGWRTVAIMPGTTMEWPQAPFYSFDQIVPNKELGYAGPIYSFDTMPDQYTLSVFQRTEYGPAPAGSLMSVVTLISSHAPWSPVPDFVDWNTIGDGSGYPKPTEKLEPAESILQRDPARVRADYAHAIAYSLQSLISWVQTYGDDDLVLMFLGDHQPSTTVSGTGPNRDVPVSIVTRDSSVLSRIDEWGWQDGLIPSDQAPVWRMDTLRDRFLATFS
ncbi:MAG TPA: sulfatase-like hydrolase/transferase [Micromonosporaceae bacterium]|jgi:hypothetical protein